MSERRRKTRESEPARSAWWRRLGWSLRLRHKLSISLSIAALLPVAVAAWVAVSIVLQGLDAGLVDQTDRQLHVGLNLLLRNVEFVGTDASRLARSRDLVSSLVDGDRAGVDNALSREAPHLRSSLVQVADAQGSIIDERLIRGTERRFGPLRVRDQSPTLAGGLSFERRVTIARHEDGLVVRAVAPVVDDDFELRGAVLLSVPLDGDFADAIKGALGNDVLLFADPTKPRSTFLDDVGARVAEIGIDEDVVRSVRAGDSIVTIQQIRGRSYSIGYAPINSLDGSLVGGFGVAVDRASYLTARSGAVRSLALGAAGAFVFAMGLAGLLSRRLSRPLQRLHEGVAAIARGDLDYRIRVSEGDEIGDLAGAFSDMTSALKENQRRLAARMRELVALHDAGRAISALLGTEQVARKTVDTVARVLNARVCALWVVGERSVSLEVGAARTKPDDGYATMKGDDVRTMVLPLTALAEEVADSRKTLRVDRVADDAKRRASAVAAGVTGSLVATPLERKGAVIGVMIVGRSRGARPFSDADANLLATFADQAATAIENARLYEEVTAFSEELEKKVRLRTAELESINAELGRTIRELKDTQAQLILSERLAGLGQLVAGVAHEINSPSAAIRGSADMLADNVARLSRAAVEVAQMPVSHERRAEFLDVVAQASQKLSTQRMPAPAATRRVARELRATLEAGGIEQGEAASAARTLAELNAPDLLDDVLPVVSEAGATIPMEYLKAHVFLHRNAETIGRAIHRIQRIVGALKGYSHLDQESLVIGDIHEGIENTLVLLDHEISGSGIEVARQYGKLPPVATYVDELNQVWTNLLHNAVQALDGEGRIDIETEPRGDGVVVRISDDGKGIPENVMPRIFEPFFTTKPKGEGTGLGLGIVRNIVEKHDGSVGAESKPGRTTFEVYLPLDGGELARSSGRLPTVETPRSLAAPAPAPTDDAAAPAGDAAAPQAIDSEASDAAVGDATA